MRVSSQIAGQANKSVPLAARTSIGHHEGEFRLKSCGAAAPQRSRATPGEAMQDSRRRSERGFVFTDSRQTPFRASTFAEKVCVKDLGTAEGRSMQLVRFEPGAVFPVHTHRGPEFVYILEGELIQRGRRLGPGWASVAASGSVDDDVRSECGCTFLTVYSE